MFKPLIGKQHTKEYLHNKEYRKQYKQYQESKINEWISLLSEVKTIHFQIIDGLHYILTPSFYDKTYQLTTFSRDMKPLGHHTYDTIDELVNDNTLFYTSKIEIIECIKGVA